jgi:DNA-binding IclR family transcriptional regulator
MRLIYHEDEFMGVSEISRKLGISKGPIHRLLTTLESQVFIQQNKESNKFSNRFKLCSFFQQYF